jgi:hypothetical protein
MTALLIFQQALNVHALSLIGIRLHQILLRVQLERAHFYSLQLERAMIMAGSIH